VKTIAIRGAFLAALVVGATGCQTNRPQVQISREQARDLDLELSGGIAADGSEIVYLTTPTGVMQYKHKGNQIESLLIDPFRDIRDVAVTSEGVVLVLRNRELAAGLAGHLIPLHKLSEDAIAVSCDREFAYVLTARGQGARLLRIALSGPDKGRQQTLLVTEDRPRALCAVRGGCLVASGGNIIKVSDPAANGPKGEIVAVLLAAIQEPVASVVADQDRLIVYFATADTTYAWIQGQIVPIFPAGSRLAWAKDTLTICQPSRPGSQLIRISAVATHTEGILKQLGKGNGQERP
jgi:hypothetical protein